MWSEKGTISHRSQNPLRFLSIVLCLAFFSSSVADVALMARSLHESKQQKLCTIRTVLEISKSIEPKQRNNNHTKSDDPQIPQPDLRFASGNEANSKTTPKPNQKTGPEPKQKHPPNRSAIGCSGISTASQSKTCKKKMNYVSQLSRQT